MEQRFEGASTSPNITFTDESIIDGNGNTLLYKDISNMYITDENPFPVFHVRMKLGKHYEFYFHKEDKDGLEMAIANVENSSIDYAKTRKAEQIRKAKRKTVRTRIALIVIALIVLLIWGKMKKTEAEREKAFNTVQEILEDYGLKDVEVELEARNLDGRNYYNANFSCSDWEKYTAREMLSAYAELDEQVFNADLDIGSAFVALGNVTCNGNLYKIYTSSNSIYKNKEEIYSGPLPEKSHTSNSTKPSAGNSTENEDDYGHNKFDAFVIAEKVVKEQLKSPSTAEFCTTTEATIGCSGNTWVVKGWVDAQNGYGAVVRADFVVTFTFASETVYTIDSCVIV